MRTLSLKLDKRKRDGDGEVKPAVSHVAAVKPWIRMNAKGPEPPEELMPTSPWRDPEQVEPDSSDDFTNSPLHGPSNNYPEWSDSDDTQTVSDENEIERADESECEGDSANSPAASSESDSSENDTQRVDESECEGDSANSPADSSESESSENDTQSADESECEGDSANSPADSSESESSENDTQSADESECEGDSANSPADSSESESSENDTQSADESECDDRTWRIVDSIPSNELGNSDKNEEIAEYNENQRSVQSDNGSTRTPYAPTTEPISDDENEVETTTTPNSQTSPPTSPPRFTCLFCEKSFSRVDAMKRHVKVIHNPKQEFKCRTCPKSFNRRDNLASHEKTCNSSGSGRSKNSRSTTTKRAHSPIIVISDDDSDTPDIQTGGQNVSESPGDLYTGEELIDRIIDQNWPKIKSQKYPGNVQDRYNLLYNDSLRPRLNSIFHEMEMSSKLNASYGFVLQNTETGQVRFFHPSANNSRLLEIPILVRNAEDFARFVEQIIHEDVLEWARRQRPDSKWVVAKVTNLTIYVNKIRGHTIGAPGKLPSFIANNSGLISLTCDPHTGKVYADNLCLFRCLSLHFGSDVTNLAQSAKVMFRRYSTTSEDEFEGVAMDDIYDIEKLFNIKIEVYTLEREIDCEGNVTGNTLAKLIRRSPTNYKETMRLNVFKNHFSYISDIDKYCTSFPCQHCGKIWRRSHLMVRHERKCSVSVKHKFKGGMYSSPPSVFDLMEDEGVVVPEDLRYYPFRATYDWESYFPTHDPTTNEKLQWETEHIPLSVSVCSNVPTFENPECFITEGDTYEVVRKMVGHLQGISEKAANIVRDQLAPYRSQMERRIAEISAEDPENQSSRTQHLTRLLVGLERYVKQMPVVGYNSGKYDLNLVKTALMTCLGDSLLYVIKRSNNIMCLTTPTLKFLDMINYLSPNYSYANYLKAYGCSTSKGFFPYEFLTHLDQLDSTELPPHAAFFSTLKGSNITEEEYEYCQKVWEDRKMATFRDFLVWYNNLDVSAFLEAIAKQSEFYKSLRVDMLKDGISVPGLTLKYLFSTLESGQCFSLINWLNNDLFYTIKDNIVGGPSIIFHRYHEDGKTRIRERELGDEAKPCRGVMGFDANALYLYALMQGQATGPYTRRRCDDDFKPHKSHPHGYKAAQWLDWVSQQTDFKIRHQFNGGEKRIGPKHIPVDGFCKETGVAYEFLGCYYHACECVPEDVNRPSGKTAEELRENTNTKLQYIKDSGYRVEFIKECEWERMVSDSEEIKTFIKKRKRPYVPLYTEERIITGIKKEQWFGLVECDLYVPTHLHEKFGEFPPIFKNCEVGKADIGNFMRSYAEQNDILPKPRTMLISSFYGEKMMLSTPLAKWYLDHGLVITKIHQIVEYTREVCFEKFGDAVSEARREGDSDKDKAIKGDTMKLTGNSSYGKTLTNKENHRNVIYCSDAEIDKYVNDKFFRKLNPLTHDFYEVESAKGTITFDLPIQIGFMVYQYAKLRMLEFVYEFVDHYLSRADYQIMETDTDSLYIALSGSSIEDLVIPEKRESFYKNRDKFLVPESCDAHKTEYVNTKLNGDKWEMEECCKKKALFEMRTPGLFKTEWVGSGMVCLNSKTYFCFGEKDKCSTKGLSKQNMVTKQNFLDVIQSKESYTGINRGFRMHNNKMYTYSQKKAGITYFYPKRIVHDDGVSTSPLLL